MLTRKIELGLETARSRIALLLSMYERTLEELRILKVKYVRHNPRAALTCIIC